LNSKLNHVQNWPELALIANWSASAHYIMTMRVRHTYLMRTTGMLLLIVCIAKLIAIYSGVKVLSVKEDLFGVSYGELTALASIMEAIIGTSAILFPSARFSIYSVGWLGILFAGYKVIRHLMDFRGPCQCMGSLFAWWPWGNDHQTLLSWGIIIVMLMSSGISLFLPTACSNQNNQLSH
jgi:hypothetical protein